MNTQIYYHYLPANHALEDLENNRIKISTLDRLNDPFELMPYRRYRLKERQPYNRVFNRISKKWGLLCFSTGWSEPLTWSHYADKHTGVAIGFEILRDKVIGVDYTSDPIRKQVELTSDLETDEKLYLDLAKVKYKKWEYENEYRILVKLEDCLPATPDGLHFLEFSNRLKVREVVLGCKFNYKKDVEKVIRLAKSLGVKVIPTRQGWGDYQIHQCGTKTNQLKEMLNEII